MSQCLQHCIMEASYVHVLVLIKKYLKTFCMVSLIFRKVCFTNLNELQKRIQFETSEGKWWASSGTTSKLGFGLSTRNHHRQVNFSSAELWPDLRPSLLHSMFGRSLKIIQESCSFLNPGELQVNEETIVCSDVGPNIQHEHMEIS